MTVGSAVTLAGTGSDPDGDSITFFWTLIERPVTSSATLSRETSSQPRLFADAAGSYLLELSVEDEHGATALDRVRVFADP